MRSKFAVLGFLAVLASSGTAFAANLDFASAAFAGAEGQDSFTHTDSDGVKLTVTAGPAWLCASITQDEDGFGVKTVLPDETDEIDGLEYLTLSFSQSVNVSDVFITDLFNEGYLELGKISINGGSAQTFAALAGQTPNTNGQLTLDLDTVVTSLTFSAPTSFLKNHDFALKGISYTPTRSTEVPELSGSAAPLALMLLVGCAILLGDRRRAGQF
jgi:hypothetical protein